MDAQLKDNVTRGSTWRRGLYMLLFAVIYSIAELLLTAVVIFQFLISVVTGSVNERLLSFGRSLSIFIYRVFLFLTYNSEQHPFPFAAWPKPEESPDASASAPPDTQDSNDNGGHTSL